MGELLVKYKNVGGIKKHALPRRIEEATIEEVRIISARMNGRAFYFPTANEEERLRGVF